MIVLKKKIAGIIFDNEMFESRNWVGLYFWDFNLEIFWIRFVILLIIG